MNATSGPNDCHAGPTVSTYYATAYPTTLNVTGTRSFAVNPSASLWQLLGATAPAEPFGPPAKMVE